MTTKHPGRPSKLTPQLQAAICKSIRETKLSLVDCGRAAGLAPNTITDWITRGRSEGKGQFWAFAVAVDKARAEGSAMLLGRIAAAGKLPKHWQANERLLSMTEPQYAPRVRMIVEQELAQAMERVKEKFGTRPELLAEVLEALAGAELAEPEEAT